jgi:glycosyltransferase involved in cell wall biosynthesis
MRLLFLDITCPKPYSPETLRSEPLGGTEATVIRVAEGLAERGHEVIVAQHNRLTPAVGHGALYTTFEELDHIQREPHAVISIRAPELVAYGFEKFGRGPKRFLWLHDFNEQDVVRAYPVLSDIGVKILAVSRMHKTAVKNALLSQIETVKGIHVGHIYNPVVAQHPNVITDCNKLVFFSSPHKGLEHALYLFQRLREIDPAFHLTIANPGYIPSPDLSLDGVKNLGALPHSEALREVSSALCVLHPNLVFPETFGLVYAEANALGVPCIAHTGAGAVREALNPYQEQVMDCRDEKRVIDRILKWKAEGTPTVSLRPEFELGAVIKRWEEELE